MGDPLPNVPLQRPDGTEVSLAGLGGDATLLIFLRHLGWLPCREHLVQVAEQIDELGVRVAVVSFAAPERLAAHARDLGLPFDYLSDGRRAAYAAFGFGRASAARVYLDPRVWATYAGLVARGRRLRPPEDDTLQLGGDVLAEAGRVRWIHRSDGPEDRPSVAELRAALGTN